MFSQLYAFINLKNFKTIAQISETGHAKNVANFDKLIKLLSSVEQYAPNEADLKD